MSNLKNELQMSKKSLLEIDSERDEIQNLLDEKTEQNISLIKKNQDLEIDLKMLAKHRQES